jgi:hypothetical protein
MDEDRSACVDTPGYRLYLASLFGIAFSIALGQTLAILAAGFTLWEAMRRRRSWRPPPVAWLVLAWVTLAVVTAVFGVEPARGLRRTRSLLWFGMLLLSAWHVGSVRRLRQFFVALVAGACVQALEVCTVRPYLAWRAVRADAAGPSFLARLVDMGGMTDGQMLMVGLVAAIVLCSERRNLRLPLTPLVAAGALTLAGFLLNFKRGSWLCACVAVGLYAVRRVGWKALVPLALVVALAASIPGVRARMSGLRGEFNADSGGRATMWLQVAPALLREHPVLGVGYGSLSNDRMRAVAPHVEPGRDHLHSNVAELLATTGWVGFALFALLMGWALRDAVLRVRRTEQGEPDARALAFGVLTMLVALLLNGLVEFNVGDSEVALVYGALLGLPVGLGAVRDV